MARFIKSLFAWRVSHYVGVWALWENAVTGRRKVTRRFSGGHSPFPRDWVTDRNN